MTTVWLERLEHYERLGFAEVPGPGNNDQILLWAQGAGHASWVKSDSTPWCGIALAGIMKECGLEKVIPKDPAAAISWLNCGVPCEPKVGAIMVTGRTGGNHVTVIKRLEGNTAHCLGGNQGDAIKTSPFELSAAKGFRWPIPESGLAESRIATAAARQQRDGTVTAATGTPTATLPAPSGLREQAADWVGEISWFQGLAGKVVDFTAFMGSNWRIVVGAVALFFLVRILWDSRQIKAWRAEDHVGGYTT